RTWRRGPTGNLRALWGSSPGDVYAAGYDGEVFHTTDGGVTWHKRELGVPLTAVWGRSASDVFLAGAGGALFHSADGNTWTRLPLPTTEDVAAIARAPGGPLVAATFTGPILRSHDNGATWSVSRPADDYERHGLFVDPAGEIWIAGRKKAVPHP